MAPLSLLKKGNIIVITLIIVILFSSLVIVVNSINMMSLNKVKRTIKEIELERFYKMHAYETFFNYESGYENERDGYFITMHYENKDYTYEIYGIEGIITIRKVDSND